MSIYPERRKLSRLPLKVTLRVKVAESAATYFGKTSNVSAQGIFFWTEARLYPGQEVECVLVLPENLTLATEPFLVGCKGTVLRVSEERPEGMVGVAMEVNGYDFSGKCSLEEAITAHQRETQNN
jgi:PilZ domain